MNHKERNEIEVRVEEVYVNKSMVFHTLKSANYFFSLSHIIYELANY